MPHPVFDGPDRGVATQNISSLEVDCVNVSYIENRAYYNEQDLQTVKLTLAGATNQSVEEDDNETPGVSHLVSIGTEAFAYCKKMHSLYSLPISLRHIGKGAFFTCISLQAVDLPDGLQTIGDNAFLYCASLVSIRIPTSVTTIANKTFCNCFRLRSLELPPTLKSVGFGAFRDCSSLISICLPKSMEEELPRHAFSGCTLLLINLRSSSNSNLLKSLQQRFHDLPLHHLCYYQSYYYLEPPDRVVTELEEILTKDEDSTIISDDSSSTLIKTDALGMNPLHVLALSARPNNDLSSILFNHIRRKIGADGPRGDKAGSIQGMLAAADDSGNEPLSYALDNMATGSGQFIAQLLKTIHMKSIAELGCQKWTCQIHSNIDRFFLHQDGPGSRSVEIRRRQARQIELIIERYIMKERLVCLELGIWKTSLDNFLRSSSNDQHDREDSRTTCGSNLILLHVVGFLYLSPNHSEGD